MESKLEFDILPQPDDTTCGPTCLHAVYRYFGETIGLEQVIREVKQLKAGGTLAVMLGCHALAMGYRAAIYTYNLQVFDPTWFRLGVPRIMEKLSRQMEVKDDPKLHLASRAYLDFLKGGGRIYFQDLTSRLIRNLLKQSIPILTGLSATYLYRTARELEVGRELVYDDIKGEPSGHFVVLCGYDIEKRKVMVADPLMPNPISTSPLYQVRLNRLLISIMLGILTFDANLLVITPNPFKEETHVTASACH